MQRGSAEGSVVFVTALEAEWGVEAAFRLHDEALMKRFAAGAPVEIVSTEAVRIAWALNRILTKQQPLEGLRIEAEQVLSDLQVLATSADNL